MQQSFDTRFSAVLRWHKPLFRRYGRGFPARPPNQIAPKRHNNPTFKASNPFRLCRLPGLTGRAKYTPSTAIRLDRKPDTRPLWPCFILSNKYFFCFQGGINFLFRPMEYSRLQSLYHLKIYADFSKQKGNPWTSRPLDLSPDEEVFGGLARRVKIVYFAGLLGPVIHVQNGIKYTKKQSIRWHIQVRSRRIGQRNLFLYLLRDRLKLSCPIHL